ncbi:MAG: hypothetical protein ACYTG0_43725 [Planctomycetota bacterium]|jgi:CXXC-20-CXXC protein
MEYRAICPSCAARLSRWWYFKCVPEFRHTCPYCGARIKSNSKWEWIGDFFIGAPVALLLVAAMAGWLPWIAAIVVTISVSSLGLLLFPYFTKFDLLEKPTRDPVEPPAPADGEDAAAEP